MLLPEVKKNAKPNIPSVPNVVSMPAAIHEAMREAAAITALNIAVITSMIVLRGAAGAFAF